MSVLDEREARFLRGVAKYMRGQQRPEVADRIEAICDGVKILDPEPKVLLGVASVRNCWEAGHPIRMLGGAWACDACCDQPVTRA